MFLWLSIVALVLWTVVFRYRRRRMYQLASKIPGSDSELPVIGVAHTLTGDTEDIMATLQHYSYCAMKNGGVLKAWLNHILYFLVVDPVDLEVVLKSCLEKDDLHRFIRKIIGFGGIFAPVSCGVFLWGSTADMENIFILQKRAIRAIYTLGPRNSLRELFKEINILTVASQYVFDNITVLIVSIWRRRRKILVPAFSPKIVENFVDVFSEQSEKLAKRLASRTDSGSFSIWPFVSTYTLDSVCETAMGVKINAQGNPNTPFLVSMNRILNLVCERIFHLWLQPEWMYKLFPQYTEHQECVHKMHSFTDDVIRKKRQEITNEMKHKTEADHEYDLGSYKSKTFLDLLIHLSGGEKGYTDEELREEVLTLTIAGTDTSAVAIGYTLALLAKYPELQEKVYQELYDVFDDSDRPLVKEDLTKLKYLERVVKESLRLFPPVPFVIRKVLEDIKLPSGHVLPAGSGVVVGIWGVHRDPKYWGPDAESFDPDRFLPERFNLKHTCSYMPFSQGPRNCLGYQYALMSVKTALSAILRRYKVLGEKEASDVPHIRVKLDIMMKAVDGYQVALEKRKPASNNNTVETN